MCTGNSNSFRQLSVAFHSLYQQGFTKQISFRKLYILVEWGGLHFVQMLIILLYKKQGCAFCSKDLLMKFTFKIFIEIFIQFYSGVFVTECYEYMYSHIKSSPCNTIKSLRHINRFNLINELKHNADHIIMQYFGICSLKAFHRIKCFKIGFLTTVFKALQKKHEHPSFKQDYKCLSVALYKHYNSIQNYFGGKLVHFHYE